MSDKEIDEEASVTKRPHEEEDNKIESEEDEWIGPLPTEAAPAKKRKGKVAVNKIGRYFHSNLRLYRIFSSHENSAGARETLFGKFTRRRLLREKLYAPRCYYACCCDQDGFHCNRKH